MPLPTVNLDDRKFQDIVDQAKTLIPQYCPEWTDHNVSDPGVALIELFAWMTDLLLYRVNQTPDKMYVKFLELLGIRLDPPRAAGVAVTFYLSAPQPGPVTIAENTEVATVRTESNPAIIFTTEADLVIRPPQLIGSFTRDIDRRDDQQWTTHDLGQIDLPGQRVQLFPGEPNPGDAFYLAFKDDHSHHVLALTVECQAAETAGVDPSHPPIQWEVWQGGADRWAPCEVESDGTGGFTWSGEVVLHLPAMAQISFRDVAGYWLRVRMIEAPVGSATYEKSPEIGRLRIASFGGTVSARHAVTILDEVLGSADGTPGQVFRLTQTPVLARDPERDFLLVTAPGGAVERWTEVADFGDSGPTDPHYTLDSNDGTITLGPALLQPDGNVYRFGKVPAKDSTLRFSRYQHGGGAAGNVPKGMVTVLKSSIPYVARVVNRRPAVGGRDGQSLDDAKLRAPQRLRTQTRAVTRDDYETLARQVPGVFRAHCLGPGPQPGGPNDPKPGTVIVTILAEVDDPGGYIPPERLLLSTELSQAVQAFLAERRLIGTQATVQAPVFYWVSVEAKVGLPANAEPGLVAEVRRRSESELFRYLNPCVGGPDGKGWPFGRELHVSELFALLQRVPGVEFVEELKVFYRETATGPAPRAAPPRLVLPPNGLICSDDHRVNRS
jgi:predicted phage baseplate assembly protein